MAPTASSDRVRGTTLQWTFTEGPQAGKTYEHTFHADGTVAYRAIADASADTLSDAQEPGAGSVSKRPVFAAYAVSDIVELVSYRADSGFTLTVALNFEHHQLVSIASTSAQWFPACGRFAAVGNPMTGTTLQ